MEGYGGNGGDGSLNYSSGGGGAGWLTNGFDGVQKREPKGVGGICPRGGGFGVTNSKGGDGGFGGGSSGADRTGAGGGGGGYTGGGGGNNYSPWGAGGGGGSYGDIMTAGNQSFPAPGGGNERGHSGNGYARITLVE